jgi:hypothetical protein
MAKEPHSAIPSWSGYIYQGKIAFYEVLRVIKKKLKEDVDYDFSDYSLEVEWQEDFAIKVGSSYKSIHQVKAYEKGTSPTKYNEALVGLFDKLDKKIGDIGFLNIWKSIGFTEGTDSKNFEELKMKNQGSYSTNTIEKTKIYEYCTGKETCDLDEADKLILKQIEEVYKKYSFNKESLTSKQYEYVLFKLYQLLDIHILEVHKGIKDKNDTMEFNEILEFFKTNYEEYSDEYKYIKVKNKLLYLISRYCQDENLCSEGEKECNHNCILYQVEKKLEKLNAKEVYNIVLNSTPQYRDYDSLIQEDGLKFGLIRILHGLTDKCRTDELHYKTDKYYLPTSITEPRNKKEIAKNILENKELKLLVAQFEIDIFISDNVKIESIENEAKKLKDFDQNELDSLYEKIEVNKIDKIKNIKIKPLNDIKKDINNAN